MKDFAAIPNELFDQREELGITPEESFFLMVLFRHWFHRGEKGEPIDPHPNYSAIARATGKDARTARRYAESLGKKGFLIRYYGQHKTPFFNLIPLMDRLRQGHPYRTPMTSLIPDTDDQFENSIPDTGVTPYRTPVSIPPTPPYKDEEDFLKKTKEGDAPPSEIRPSNYAGPLPLPGTSPVSELDEQIDALCKTFTQASGRLLPFTNAQKARGEVPELRRKTGEFIELVGCEVAEKAIWDICRYYTRELKDPLETVWAAISMWRKREKEKANDNTSNSTPKKPELWNSNIAKWNPEESPLLANTE